MPLLLHSLFQGMTVPTPSSMRKAAPSVVTSMHQEPSKNQGHCDLVHVMDSSYKPHKPDVFPPSSRLLSSDPGSSVTSGTLDSDAASSFAIGTLNSDAASSFTSGTLNSDAVSSVMSGSQQEPCTNHLQSTDPGDCIKRKDLPTAYNTVPICLAPMTSFSGVDSSEVSPGSAGLPMRREMLSSGICGRPEVGEAAAGRSEHTLKKRHSSLRASRYQPVVPGAGEVSARKLKHPQKKDSSSSRGKRTTEAVISRPGAVTAGRPKYPQRNGSSSSKDTSRRHNSSMSKRCGDKSPAEPNKQRLREVSQTVLFSPHA